jgi:hypothetical protein
MRWRGLWTAIGNVAGCVGYELDVQTVERLKEAVTALEAAIAEAWPPEAVGTPVRTDKGRAAHSRDHGPRVR